MKIIWKTKVTIGPYKYLFEALVYGRHILKNICKQLQEQVRLWYRGGEGEREKEKSMMPKVHNTVACQVLGHLKIKRSKTDTKVNNNAPLLKI